MHITLCLITFFHFYNNIKYTFISPLETNITFFHSPQIQLPHTFLSIILYGELGKKRKRRSGCQIATQVAKISNWSNGVSGSYTFRHLGYLFSTFSTLLPHQIAPCARLCILFVPSLPTTEDLISINNKS